MIVYRVEDASGAGPYQGNIDWKIQDHTQEGGRPSPQRDRPPYYFDRGMLQDLRSGFTSKEQLGAWFSQVELENLAAMGLISRNYEVSEVEWASDKQCVFDKHRAKICINATTGSAGTFN